MAGKPAAVAALTQVEGWAEAGRRAAHWIAAAAVPHYHVADPETRYAAAAEAVGRRQRRKTAAEADPRGSATAGDSLRRLGTARFDH